MWPFAVRKSSGYGAYDDCDAHRFVCTKAHGAAPTPKHQAAHACGKKLCINRHHLSWTLPLQNAADAMRHGTLRGGGIYRQRLFETEVRAIRASDESLVKLGQLYGMAASYIGKVRRGDVHTKVL